MKRPRLDVKKYSGALGAEVFGLDLAQPLGKETLEEVRNAWLEHLVLFFRDQRLTPTQHYAFAQQFGELMEHPYIEGIADYPEIIEIVRTPGQTYNFDRCFHADLTFLDEPAAGAALYARELPPYGGDTMFANMYLAYDTLSDGMKTMLAGLEAVHRSGDVNERYHAPFKGMKPKAGEAGTAIHPVIRTHPETGRKSLYVNQGFTKHFKDMTESESAPILDFLFRHATRPEFICRFHWQPGSLILWDNRITVHNAVADFYGEADSYRRVVHRATIGGDRPSI